MKNEIKAIEENEMRLRCLLKHVYHFQMNNLDRRVSPYERRTRVFFEKATVSIRCTASGWAVRVEPEPREEECFEFSFQNVELLYSSFSDMMDLVELIEKGAIISERV